MPISPANATLTNGKSTRSKTVTIVGAGLAGLAAGCALAEAGYQVQVLERRPYVGGRASSYEHPGAGEVIDNCQHILLGCCTNLVAFYERLGVEDQISWFRRYTYIEPGGRRSVIAPSWLPAPFHASAGFLCAPAFSWRDKLAIARGMLHFIRRIPEDTAEDFAAWCVRTRQTPGAIRRFWQLLLSSALNDDLDRISMRYAGKVIRDSFLSSPRAGIMGIPRLPLSQLYDFAAEYIRARGGVVHLRAGVDAFEQTCDGWCLQSGDRTYKSESVVLALSFEAMQKLIPLLPKAPGVGALAEQLGAFEHSPITSVHLWFDREVTELEKAVLLDTTFEWMYNVARLQPGRHESPGSYLELVISNSKTLVPMRRQEIIDLALRELPLFFPRVRDAVLVKAAVVKEVRATYSVRPLLDSLRSGPRSPWPGVYLAGDWTATGWPATMEGAVRSGYIAAEALTHDQGATSRFLVPDLPPSGFMRFFG